MSEYPEARDEIDVLFARLERVAAPAALEAGVRSMVAARARARRWFGAVATVLSLVGAVVVSFFFGVELTTEGGLALVQTVMADWELLAEAPADVALAVVESVPWLLAALVAACLAALAAGARLALLTPVGAGPRGWRT